MAAQDEFRRALETGDVKLLQRIHPILFPHAPAAQDLDAAEVQLHMARTMADWLALNKRAYSHRWLIERGLPSQLPDRLRASAEQICPVVKEAVLVSANTNSKILKPAMAEVQQAMADAVLEAEADGRLSDSEFVRDRIMFARGRAVRQLGIGRRN